MEKKSKFAWFNWEISFYVESAEKYIGFEATQRR